MEQTALRPKPMPGQEPGSGGRSTAGRKLRIGRKLGTGRKFGIGRKDGIEEEGGAGQSHGAGRKPGTGHRSGPGHRPHAARRRGRRLVTLLLGLLVSAVLVLTGVGLGTVSATVIGMSKLADMRKAAQAQGGQPGRQAGPGAPNAAPAPAPTAKPPQKHPAKPAKPDARIEGARPALGVEAVDAPAGPGALLIGVHSPGPGHTAGLVRGDVLLALGKTRVGSAKALAAAVADAAPGRNVTVTVRHGNGARQMLTVTPGFVT
ncbi:PDZ domain-containing protein [Streptomyces sp. NPDC048436]|uniref:PDZ domain-containing protein n=1 Tax=Streptomyces sp. NPDC048436 TaxID=3365550 RepID=UPI003721585F